MAQMSGHSAFWIDFEEARRAVETLVELAHDEPDERPPCVLLVGQSGMGKTSILRAMKIPDGEAPDVQAGAVSSQARAAAQSRWSQSYGSA